MEAIFERRSIRKYTDQKIPKETILRLLRAGMAAPSAGNEQPWQFIVTDDRSVMSEIMKTHPYSSMLMQASHAVIICGDTNFKKFEEDYWVQDCSAAAENMLILAQELGIGGVWLGIYPVEQRMDVLRKLFELPDHVIPFCILSFGYPAEKKDPSERFQESRVHWNKW